MPLLDVIGASKEYAVAGVMDRILGRPGKFVHALNDINLSIDRGEAIGIVGESGAGKTTLASLIVGLETPTSGEISLGGTSLAGSDRKAWSRMVQLVWQDPPEALNPRQRVGVTIAEPMLIQGMIRSEADARVLELMREVDLDTSLRDRLPGELSGGQAQRVVIARALAVDPDLVICDEPASALDAPVKLQIAKLLLRLRRERGLAYLIIAHDLPLVQAITDRLVVMYQGSMVEAGPTRELLEQPMHPYTRLLVSSDLSLVGDKEAHGSSLASVEIEEGLSGDVAGGCSFMPRCPDAEAGCGVARIELDEINGREIACLRVSGQSPT